MPHRNTPNQSMWADGKKTRANENGGDSIGDVVRRKFHTEEDHIIRCIDAYPRQNCPGHALVTLVIKNGVKSLKQSQPIVKCSVCEKWLQIKLRHMLVAARPEGVPDVAGDQSRPDIVLGPSFNRSRKFSL